MHKHYIGCVEATSGMMLALEEDYLCLSSADLSYMRIVDPIHQIRHRFERKEILEMVAREMLRQHLNWVRRNFGLHHAPTWEQVRDGKFDEFNYAYQWDLWSIYVEDELDISMLKEVAGSRVDVDPMDLAESIVDFARTVILKFYQSECLYVLRSPFSSAGTLRDHDDDPVTGTATLSVEGEVECFGLPEETMEKARRYDREMERCPIG